MEDAGDLFDPFAALDPRTEGSSSPPARRARFQPKLKGKLIKPEPAAPPPAAVVKEPEAVVAAGEFSGAVVLSNGKAEDVAVRMEVDVQEEDVVVREIDVFCNPDSLDEGAQLYVMQYRLRPSWRPYELSERCEEVRVKPEQSEMEVVLNMDIDSENYDQRVEEPLRIKKQTLSSSKVPSVSNHAVGILIKNQLHLNPVDAVFQFVPSMAHLNIGGTQKKPKNLEAGTKTDKGKQVAEIGNEDTDDTEPWISLVYNDIDSPSSFRYQQKMMAQKNDFVQFKMKTSDYINSLCPGPTVKKIRKDHPGRFFPELPMEERLRKWLSEVCPVNRFAALMYFSPTNSMEDLLKVLKDHAYLVQGLWVSKSEVAGYEGHEAVLRDYILFLFSKNHAVHYKKLDELKISLVVQQRLLSPFAYKRPTLNDWKFKVPTDFSFIKDYPHIVKQQELAWSNIEQRVIESLLRAGKKVSTKHPINSNMTKNTTVKVGPNSSKISNGPESSTATVMPIETREFLPKALQEIFSDHKAHSINSIIRKLRDMALSKSSRPKEDPKTKALISAAEYAASASVPDLISVISNYTVQVHNVYVWKSSENSALDPLRNVVINLFIGKENNAKLKKQEIKQAAQISLKREITDSEYNQVMNQLCVHSRGAWVLKTSEANPV